MPAAYRPVEALTVGRDGTVWLRLGAAPGTHRNSVLSTEILAADSAGFWLREIDEWDVPSLVRYRIEPGG